jgi:AbrB family looped-hinge helix DNA binding protein
MVTAKTSSKGQLVIPKSIRDALHIKSGTLLELRVVADHIEIYPLPEDPVGAFRGSLKGRESLANELISEHRKEVEQDAKR